MIRYLNEIRAHYEQLTPLILSRGNNKWLSPYTPFFDWNYLFSPIEKQTWSALRYFGKCPFYPQYPVNRFFVDFGNPKVKVAIECDGKEWHTDKEKDANRDKVILSEGWTVFRISGADCFRSCDEYFFLERYSDRDKGGIISNYYQNIDGLIKAIAIFYFGYKDYSFFEMEIDSAFNCLMSALSPGQLNSVYPDLTSRLDKLKSEYYTFKDQEEYHYD